MPLIALLLLYNDRHNNQIISYLLLLDPADMGEFRNVQAAVSSVGRRYGKRKVVNLFY